MAEVPVESGLLLLDVVEKLGLAGVVVVVVVVVVVCSVQSKICTRVSLIACSSCVSTRAKKHSGVGAIYHQVGHGLAVQVSMTEYTQAGTAQLVELQANLDLPQTWNVRSSAYLERWCRISAMVGVEGIVVDVVVILVCKDWVFGMDRLMFELVMDELVDMDYGINH
ncbi:hypothetical protein BASA81_015525 [Batrachochytrium salamandrivorans]|nr:hypothetical protein BASA81_015525 [Batrachochytrium salamandrivorans]